MKEESKKTSNEPVVSRRSFIKGVAAGAIGLAGMGILGGCESANSQANDSSSQQSQTSRSAFDITSSAINGNQSGESGASLSDTGYPWLREPKMITDFIDEQSYDIVVVGAGIAGCTAAQSASEEGVSVALIEKFSEFTSHGSDIGAIGTKLQEEKGYEYDRNEAARLIYQWSQSQANWYLIKTFIEKSGEVLDYYIDMARNSGLTCSLNDQMTARSDWYELDERFRQLKFTAHNFTSEEDMPFPAYNLVKMLYDSAVENGTTVLFDTKCEQLIREGDTITGVIVSDQDGYKKILANKGVILATGGIGGNEEMIDCFCPIAKHVDKSDYMPKGGNTGDGIVMGLWAGAARSRCFPAPLIHPVNLSPMGPGFDTSWLSVNRDGMRFCCEVAYEPIVTNARLNAPGNVAYAIFDSNYKSHYQNQEPVKSQPNLDGLEEAVEEAVINGEFYKADTLEELAETIQVPPENLLSTAKRYNQWCESGVDEDFGVPERFLSSVEDGPFYACKINAWMLALPYGLHVDQNSQVCDEDDNPIGHLFAIGNVQGDFFANSYPVCVPGTSHGRSVTFGRLVGKALANDSTLNTYEFGK